MKDFFCLCPEVCSAVDVIVDSRFFCGNGPGCGLPDWLTAGFNRIRSDNGLVSLFRGPSGEPVSVTAFDDVLTFAGSSASFDRIDVGVWEKKAVCPANASGEGNRAVGAERNVSSSVQSVLPPILREFFVRHGLLLMHSAALRLDGGKGILIAADGGGGKTTTAISLVRRGAKLLGDDLNALDISDGGIKVLGFPEMMNITPETMSFFAELEDAPSRVPEGYSGHKKVVAPSDVYGEDCMAEEAEVKVVYFVRVSNEGPRVKRLGSAEAMGRLIHCQTFANGQVPDDFVFSRLSDLLENAKAYVLETGKSPEKLGEWIIGNVDEQSR